MPTSLRVVFDFSCPYCYIAWHYIRRLKQSLKFSDEWLTWNIHPEVGPEGMDIRKVLTNFDPVARREKLNGLGFPVGVAPGDMTFVPDTRLALQAVEFAAVHGHWRAWCDSVFAANFEQKKDIGDKTVLLAIAQEIGLPVAELEVALSTGLYAKVLTDHDQLFAKLQVEWVPTVFTGETKILEGAFTFAQAEETIAKLVANEA